MQHIRHWLTQRHLDLHLLRPSVRHNITTTLALATDGEA